MNREIQALVLVLLGGATLRIGLDGTYLRYVKPSLLPFLLLAGVVVLALGLLSAWYDGLLRREPTPAPADTPSSGSAPGTAVAKYSHGHSHDHGGPLVAWLLLLPILAIFLVAPPALGAFAANRSAFAPAPNDGFPPLEAGDVVDLPVKDYVTRAVWDAGRTLDGRTIRLTGFAVDRDDGGWDLARLSLSCCAADAIAARVQPVGDVVPVAEGEWVEVTGKWVEGGGVEDPRAVPWFEVEEIVGIEEPEQVYE